MSDEKSCEHTSVTYIGATIGGCKLYACRICGVVVALEAKDKDGKVSGFKPRKEVKMP